MEKWWNKRFINRRDWILDNLTELSLTSDETLVILMIDFLNQHMITITHGILAEKFKKDSDEIDDILSHLTAKGYLSLQFDQGKIIFSIDGVFDDHKEKSIAFDQSMFDLFESEFGRPLSQTELQRMSDWLENYDQKLIGYALREAVTYDRKSFDYIDRILVEWKKTGMSAEQYERGDR